MGRQVSDSQWYKIGWRLAVDTPVLNERKTGSLLSDEVRVSMYRLFDFLAGNETQADFNLLWSRLWTGPAANSEAERFANQAAITLLGAGPVSNMVLAVAEFAATATRCYIRWQGQSIEEANRNLSRTGERYETYRVAEGQEAYLRAMRNQASLIREMLPELPL
jgi:hypothetical protein